VASVALSAARCGRLTIALLASSALALAAGASAAEGSQDGAEAQASSTKPVVALLGTVAATVDQVAGHEVLPAPATEGAAPEPSPSETVAPTTADQSTAPGPEDLLRGGASGGPTRAMPRPRAPDVGATLSKVTAPVRRAASGTLHRAGESVDGVVAQVPAVAQSGRRAVSGVIAVAGGLLAKTPLAAVASQTSRLLSHLAATPQDLVGEPLGVSLPGEPGLIADPVISAAIPSPGETASCAPCAAGLHGSAGVAVAGSTGASGVAATAAFVEASAPPYATAGSTPASSSPSHAPSMPRSPAPGGVSSAGGGAVGAALALALLWLFATVLPGVKRRLGEGPQVRLIAPFELILQRPG
jgi:hypothetical protein